MQLLKLVLCLVVITSPALAQYSPSPNDPQAPVETPRYKGRVTDFPKMRFLCNADTSGDYIATAVCSTGEIEARTQARYLDFDMDMLSGRDNDNSIILYVHVTSAGRAPRATSIHFELSRTVDGGVDSEADRNSPAAFPRRGKLVIYEDTITAIGQGDSLEEALRRSLQVQLRKMFRMIKNGEL